MKKAVVSIVIIAMLAMLAACGRKEEPVADSNNNESSNESGITTIANPYVEATDEEIYEKLGITMHAEAFTNKQSEFIVGGTMAQVDTKMQDPEGNEVKASLRATAKEDEVEYLHGLYFDDMTEPEVIKDGACPGIDLIFRTCDGGNWNIYEWSNEGIHYCLTYSGAVSQMQVSAVLDQAMAAVGLVK